MTEFAVKRLATVEIEPNRSRQHELNAGRLRKGLGFPEGRTEGDLSILYYHSAASEPLLLEGKFTLYDSRANHSTRTEYRLYYHLPGLVDLAEPGDLLVLCRESGTDAINGIIAGVGTLMEQRLEELLKIGDEVALRQLVVRTPEAQVQGDAVEWVDTLAPDLTAPVLATAARQHPLFDSAVKAAKLPPTKEMAAAGREIAGVVWRSTLDADEFVTNGLEAESELFFAIEREVGSRSLHALQGEGLADLDKVLAWALRIQQSRKARRGQSLQHHFGYLLIREGIPHTPQCPTERGETPDFVIPGREQYEDPGFPDARLRMVACKSTVRERWGQIIKEADRIPEKYLLTVDENLSADLVRSMRQSGLRVFLPMGLIDAAYSEAATREMLESVGDLLENLKGVL